MLKFACKKGELSCIIGNLFVELEPPCGMCNNDDELVIYGTTFAGKRAVLIVTEYGFDYDGSAADVERIREKRCAIEPKTTTRESK